MAQPSDHLKGLLLTCTGVLILSPDALLIRLLDLDVWTLVFWRGFGIATIVGAIACYRLRSTPLKVIASLGPSGFVLAVFMALGTLLFVTGISHTNAANVLVIIAGSPLFAALFGWLIMRERVSGVTILAILMGIAGVAITASGSIGQPDFLGNLAAVGCALVLGINFALLRRARLKDMTAAFAIGGAILAVTALAFAPTLEVATAKIPHLLILCGFVQPISFALIMLGPRFVPAAEASLVMLLETALGPVWVWLFLAESPTTRALLGGVIVFAAIAAHSLIKLRRTADHSASSPQQTS